MPVKFAFKVQKKFALIHYNLLASRNIDEPLFRATLIFRGDLMQLSFTLSIKGTNTEL